MNCDGELFMNFSSWTNNANILLTFHELFMNVYEQFIKSWSTFHRGVSIVSMLFPWRFSGMPWNAMDVMLFPWHFSWILWHPGGMPWTLCYFYDIPVEFYGIQVECHGIPWNATDIILFPWHFNGIIWHPGGIPWNAMDIILFPWHFSLILWHPGGMPWNSMGYRRLVLWQN